MNSIEYDKLVLQGKNYKVTSNTFIADLTEIGLKPGPILMLQILRSFDGPHGCYPSEETIAERRGWKDSNNVSRELKKLATKGIIRINPGKPGKGNSNEYDLSPLYELLAARITVKTTALEEPVAEQTPSKTAPNSIKQGLAKLRDLNPLFAKELVQELGGFIDFNKVNEYVIELLINTPVNTWTNELLTEIRPKVIAHFKSNVAPLTIDDQLKEYRNKIIGMLKKDGKEGLAVNLMKKHMTSIELAEHLVTYISNKKKEIVYGRNDTSFELIENWVKRNPQKQIDNKKWLDQRLIEMPEFHSSAEFVNWLNSDDRTSWHDGDWKKYLADDCPEFRRVYEFQYQYECRTLSSSVSPFVSKFLSTEWAKLRLEEMEAADKRRREQLEAEKRQASNG